MKRIRTAITAISLIVLLAIGAAFAFAVPGSSAKKPSKHPTAKGNITNLWPGAVSTMRVTVKNPYPKAIVVKNLKTKVGTGTSALGTCSASVLKIQVWKGKVTIKPRKSKAILVKITMAASAPNTCQGTRFPLSYVVKAVPKK
ncbi:MAG TPA: hypothetical protein VK646_03005 [Actinomycetota bacterium]|nr:hypothetical protein [Actinomycetota bacterium]